MLRVPINRPADVFFDNQSVVNDGSTPYYVLNNKHNSIWYHRVQEAHTAGIQTWTGKRREAGSEIKWSR